MKSNRRDFLKNASLSLAALSLTAGSASAAEPQKKQKQKAAPAEPLPSFAKKSKMKLGTVTYNLAMDWDIPTIIANCTEAKFEGVELRTTHKHGVEVSLDKSQRAEVKKRFADSPVALASLGSAFDYHTIDQAKLRKDIEATKEYIVLAQDVGAMGVKVRPNGLPKEVPVEKTLEQIIENDCVPVSVEEQKKTKNIFRQLLFWLSYQVFRGLLFLFTFYFKQKR